MKHDHNRRLTALESVRGADRVTQIDILGVPTCGNVEHRGGFRMFLGGAPNEDIPAPPCPLGEACTCQGAA